MTQNDPESVSIVICTYNRAATLERALASLASLELPSKPLAKREMPPNPYSPHKERRAFYYYRSACQWAPRDLALHIASRLRQYTELVTLKAIGT